MHIGYTGPEANVGMSIEIGVEGASFHDSLICGSTLIQIPVASIPAISKSTPQIFQVVVDASNAASTTQNVNLTVRHVDTEGIVWEDSKSSSIQIGQIISTNISTNDEWTDWEELAPPINTPRFSGFKISTTSFSIIFTTIILAITIKRRKKK